MKLLSNLFCLLGVIWFGSAVASESTISIGALKAEKPKSTTPKQDTKTQNSMGAMPVDKSDRRASKVTLVELDKDISFNKSANKSVRSKVPEKSSRYHEFDIYDAVSFLINDFDGDGYYNEFEIVFDADTVFDWAEVYAVLYIRRDGSDWQEYFVTDVFDIYGVSSTDDFSVTTVLNFDYPTDEYDILIDLYEVGYSGIVATYSSLDDFDLALLPLEDRTREANFSSGFWFYDVQTDLIDDYDADGFYSRFSIGFDADTHYASASVYAEIFFINESSDWELEYTTQTFDLQNNASFDRVQLEFAWDSGYPTGYYDFKIVLRDSYSGELLTEASGEFAALDAIPLESYDRDRQANSGGAIGAGGGQSTSYQSGGAVWLASGLLLVLLGARKRARSRESKSCRGGVVKRLTTGRKLR